MRPLLAALVVLLTAGGWQAADAQDVARGKILYETRCVSCHDRSVHNRGSRNASDYASLRKQVIRWNANLGGAWKTDEIDDVTAYLNEVFYRYKCPTDICEGPARAALRRERG